MAKKGTKPRVIRQQQFECSYIFGAVCPTKDKALGLVLPLANTQEMIEYLRLIPFIKNNYTHIAFGSRTLVLPDATKVALPLE